MSYPLASVSCFDMSLCSPALYDTMGVLFSNLFVCLSEGLGSRQEMNLFWLQGEWLKVFFLCVPMQVCDAVYGLVVKQAQAQYEAVVQSCEARRPPLEASIRTDMDQIITSKEHVSNKIKGEPSVTCVVQLLELRTPAHVY